MHIKMVLFLCILSVSLAATAQESRQAAPQATQSSAKAQTIAGPITIRGCINGGKERYTLTQQSTNNSFELQGDKSRFESLRGKPVELTAREAPPSQSTGVNDLPKLAVNEVHAIAGQCPFAEGGGSSIKPIGTPIAVPGTQAVPTQNPAPSAATPRYEAPGAPNETPPSVGNNPNVQGASGAPSPGSGNPPKEPPPPPR